MSDRERPHSAEQFGRQRAYWWDPGFLALLAQRIGLAQLDEARSVLDVGCGQCHWSATILSWLPRLERLCGVDFEARWATGAEEALRAKVGEIPFATDLRRADAHALPFPDAAFDVVTCQTLLMHLRDPQAALAEMFRVARPGGLVIVSEPSNFQNRVGLDSAALSLGVEALADRYRLWLACHLGRRAPGGGDHNLGDRLPSLFAACGAEGFQIVVNDRAHFIAPPYAREEDTAALASDRAWWDLTFGPERARTIALAVAGGLAEAEAEQLLGIEERIVAERYAQVATGSYVAGGGGSHFVAWGRRAGG
ncbi:MAG: SAM-dependent methyltransferase [Myxococcales bacterium]|nr:SAM-dependent methyltransferase [Myxococcales bacterium]